MRPCLALMVCTLMVVYGDAAPKGHLEPLGSHCDLIPVAAIDPEIRPDVFYEEYIRGSKPVLLKGAAKKYWKAFSYWNDDYLKQHFGNIKFLTEHGKKENRADPSSTTTLGKFIDEYGKANKYCVDSLPKEMRQDLSLHPPLACGGYDSLMQDAVMWYSSGGTKSVLHRDDSENIGCLLSGRKTFTLFNKNDVPARAILDNGDHSRMDVDKVDLIKYSALAKAQGYVAEIEAGDCIFLPSQWYHQVRSYDRNLAVNIWFTTPKRFDSSQCPSEWSDASLKELIERRSKVTLGSLKFPVADDNRQQTDEAEVGVVNQGQGQGQGSGPGEGEDDGDGDRDGPGAQQRGPEGQEQDDAEQQDGANDTIDWKSFLSILKQDGVVKNKKEAIFLWETVYGMKSPKQTMTGRQFDSFTNKQLEKQLSRIRQAKQGKRDEL